MIIYRVTTAFLEEFGEGLPGVVRQPLNCESPFTLSLGFLMARLQEVAPGPKLQGYRGI